MMSRPILSILAALLASLVSQAQQTPQPQPAPTQPQATPCATAPQPQPPKGWHFNLPKGLQQAIDKQRQQIQNQTGITVPSTQDLANQAKQAMSPCGKVPAPAPQSTPTPATPAPAKTATPPTTSFEPPTSVYGFACPVGTKLHVIPGYSYCDGPDNKSTPAILIMPGMPVPAGYFTQTAAEATTPKTKEGAQ